MNEDAAQPDLTGMLRVLRDAHGSTPRPYYQSYLLRLWREHPGGGRRISLENITSGERHAFTQFEQLVAFLEGGEREPEASRAPAQAPSSSSQPESPSASADGKDSH